jgi:hypothetical protein
MMHHLRTARVRPLRAPRGPALALLSALLPGAALAQRAAPPTDVPPAYAAIRRADLERDLYALAADAMRGREAGTPDEMRASVWIADQLRRIGVEPLGEDGSYFQWFAMTRTRVSATASRVVIGGQSLPVYGDALPFTLGNAEVRGRVVWLDDPADTSVDIRGRIVAARLRAPDPARIRTTTNSPDVRYATAAITATQSALLRRRPAAVLLVSDATTDGAFDDLSTLRSRGVYDVDRAAGRFATQPYRLAPVAATPNASPAVVLVRAAMGERLARGPEVELVLGVERFETPSPNIVGTIRGTDPALRDEYVLFSSHQDHDGVRYVIDGDSVWAGADDNGSGSVALLAAARAFAKQPGRRSALFVYHGAEERGLLGSRYHAAHPVVPLERIVAVLNAEMIGRNHPDSASLLGVQPPHRNSADLVEHALRANERTGRFALDSLWDRPTHPEGWYFRSDHVPYARLNVPAVMFTTNLHADYHTPRDKPERIDYAKLTRMTQWLYLTGWYVANAPARPRLDAAFRLER